MENYKLISLSDYEDSIDLPTVSDSDFRIKSRHHRNFLKQPLKLGMFVPCDENGNVLEEPNLDKMPFCSVNGEGYDYEVLKYQQAKEKVLFEGFELCVGRKAVSNNNGVIILIHNDRKFSLNGKQITLIEDLVKYNLTLTNNKH